MNISRERSDALLARHLRERTSRRKDILQERIKELEKLLRTRDVTILNLNKRVADLEKREGVDALTGLFNRLRFRVELESLFGDLRTGRISSVWVLFIDLDHFKQINDTYDHLVGDQVLQTFAEHLKALSQHITVAVGRHRSRFSENTDPVGRQGGENLGAIGRQGGEEFVGCMADRPDIADIARKFLKRIERVRFKEHPNLRITASIGVASVTLENAGTPDQLLKKADDAMKIAKQTGRNRVVVAQ